MVYKPKYNNYYKNTKFSNDKNSNKDIMKNTPFVINLSAPQPNVNDKKCNVDLNCYLFLICLNELNFRN